ncbi:MAG: putative DNA binding domain-containing protein [Atopobiaceae bacterium]|jgi:ATP-dependent DNA helicase RecG|nr:putative DNA binding domain-containing protein [Atopobiaceae bacterium]MDD2587564.1 ATP-binding protein [Atopobiaceae bacterium]
MTQCPVTDNDVSKLSAAKENHYYDRKSARIKPDHLAQHIVALANAAGGKLAIGIEDDGEVTGFKADGAQTIEGFEQCAIMDCLPAPDVTSIRIPVINSRGQEDLVLVLDVAPSSDRVIGRKKDGKVFLRQGDKSPELSHEQIRALEYDKSQRVFEDELVPDSSIGDVDHEVLDRYKVILGTDATDEQVLESRRFMRDGRLTVAGALLFAEDPSSFMPQARVRVLRFDGTKMETGERLNISKDRTFDGPIPKVVDGAYTLISSMLREFQFLGPDGKFQVVPEYPEFAWFEGIVNAVTHRDYAFRGDYIRVSMYDDRLEILSPGKLPNTVTLDNMRTTRYSRNPRIARTLVEFGWVRELNEGVQRIYSEMQRMLLNDPVYTEPEGSRVQLTLENNIVARTVRRKEALDDRLSEEVMSSLGEYELAAVQLAFANGHVTTRELAGRIGRSTRSASKALKDLASRGILHWHGSSRNDPAQRYSLD